MPQKLTDVGEFGLIEIIRRMVKTTAGVVKGIGDDAAVLTRDSRKYQLFTTDMIVEGTHFTARDDPRAIGYKALAVNISDVAAMGGLPRFALVSLGVPGHKRVSFVKAIYQGMNRLAGEFKIGIVGGDTVKTNKVTINVSLLGEVNKKDLVTRAGARKGDVIFVTGPLGRSWKDGKHLRFIPRIREARFLVERFPPSAMIDISDGLAADLGHILQESGVGALLFAERIPLRPNATVKEALFDGEDFELAFTLAAPEAARFLAFERARRGTFFFFPIGRIVDRGQGLGLVRRGRVKRLRPQGYVHF